MDTLSFLQAWGSAVADAATAVPVPSPLAAVAVAAVVAVAGWAAAARHTRLWNRAFAVRPHHHALCAVAAAVTFGVALTLPFVAYGTAVARGVGAALDAEWADSADTRADLVERAGGGAVRAFEGQLATSRPDLARLVAYARQSAPMPTGALADGVSDQATVASDAAYAVLRSHVVDRPAGLLRTLFWSGVGVAALAQITAFAALAWSARRDLAA
ncbi:hypothetical protein [Rubrivirga sp. IMCC43871]|uniref:hypothetical protein n=1 Tax=Rubrivirga sp. IMCC43871 TaxID=3391575 RepID=UPI00398FEF4A